MNLQLRPEARAVGWAELDSAQKSAFVRIVAALEEAVGALATNTVGEDRMSRILLLSGARGTGKTTVFLSARSVLHPSADVAKFGDAALRKRIKELSKNVVWLETLDMEMIPRSTNLLAAILARVDRAIRPDAEASTSSGTIFDTSPDQNDALQQLQRLQADVASAWDDDFLSHNVQFDSTTFTIESIEVERKRLGLNRKLSEVLDTPRTRTNR